MAKHHKVDISARQPQMKSTTSTDRQKVPSATDAGMAEGLEHKVPLSEAVLRAVGLFGGAATTGKGKSAKTTVTDLRDKEGAVFLPAPDSPDGCTTPADVVSYLSAKHGGYFERTPLANGRVMVKFTYGEDADTATGSGATTKDAVRAMASKLGETFECLSDAEES